MKLLTSFHGLETTTKQLNRVRRYEPSAWLVALSEEWKLRSEAQFYCFLFHKSQKSFTVAGPCPAYNAAFRIMPI